MQPEVERFVVEHVGSVDELEILLLVFKHPETSWRGETVARELRLDVASTLVRLGDLLERGFLRPVPGMAGSMRYASPSYDIDRALALLVDTYARHRSSVIRLILSNPNERVQSFG